MQLESDDWRLLGQEKYLFGAILSLKKYSDRKTETDHDHCEFCGAKFSDTIPGKLTEGYTTQDDYWWLCNECFENFKDKFKFLSTFRQ
jgi:hypothetical protein